MAVCSQVKWISNNTWYNWNGPGSHWPFWPFGIWLLLWSFFKHKWFRKENSRGRIKETESCTHTLPTYWWALSSGAVNKRSLCCRHIRNLCSARVHPSATLRGCTSPWPQFTKENWRDYNRLSYKSYSFLGGTKEMASVEVESSREGGDASYHD